MCYVYKIDTMFLRIIMKIGNTLIIYVFISCQNENILDGRGPIRYVVKVNHLEPPEI